MFDLKYMLVFSRVDGNPRLFVYSTSCPTDGKSSNVGIIVGVVVGVLLAVAIAVAVTLYCISKKKRSIKGATEKTGKIST